MKRPFKCPTCGLAYFAEKEGCQNCQMSEYDTKVAGILAHDMLDQPMPEITETETSDDGE